MTEEIRDQRITIVDPTGSISQSGSVSKSTRTVATVWSKVRELHGSLTSNEGYERAKQKAIFTIDYRDDIESEHLIQWNGEEYEIETFKAVRDSFELQIRGALKE